jgi:ABC-type nitrate/sulfonate/bicarbonate transport system substrate-binding protein
LTGRPLKLLRIGGVPEHFNLPWHLLLEAGGAQRFGVDARWSDYPDGSGAMAAALREGRLDVAMLLTEGAVAGIAAGGGFRIVGAYTQSPLIWGIHVPAASRFRQVADIQGARYAISRSGSGSHLMSFVHAREQGWPLDALQFVPVGNLAGAVEAFAATAADVFFWEKFMTKPLVDAGQFRRVGEFVAPWPAFVVCAADAVIRERPAELDTLLAAVFVTARELVASPAAAALIAERYALRPADVAEWLSTTRWASHASIARRDVDTVVVALGELGLIDSKFHTLDAIADLPPT